MDFGSGLMHGVEALIETLVEALPEAGVKVEVREINPGASITTRV